MKKLFRSLIAVAAAAAAMTSCAKEMQENFSNTQQINVNFVAQDADTKTEFGTPEDGKVPVIWKEGDKVGLNVNLNGDMKVYAVDAVPTDGGKKAQFKYEGTLPAALTAPYTFYVISPNSGYVSSSTKNGYFQFLVPSKQTPTETSVDPAAQLLFAVSNNYEGIPTDVVNLQFEHLVAYGNLSVKNLDTEGKKVTGIDLIFETNVIGRYYIYPAKTGDERIEEVAGDKVVSLVTERLENNIFSVMPGDVSGKTLTVIVKVEGGAYKKQITIPADKAFKAGVISKFGVDLTGAEYEKEKTYSLVTDVATLKAGDQVIIGSSASLDTYGFVAMSTSQQQYNIAAVNVDNILKEKKLIAPGANIDVFTLEEGKAAGHFYLKSTNGKYLLRNPDSERAKNKNDLIARLKTDADYDDGCANWAFTLVNADTGELTIIANTNISSRKYIKANPNSGTLIFSCYSQASSMVAPCLYKLEDTPEPPKELKIAEVKVLTTGDAAWSSGFTTSQDFRNVAMDDDYIYLAEFNGTKKVWALKKDDFTATPVSNGTIASASSYGIYTACPRIMKNTNASINGGKDVLLVSNLGSGGDYRLYVYDKGIASDPSVITLSGSGRLGDTFTTYGTFDKGILFYAKNGGNGVVTFQMNGVVTGTRYLVNRLALTTDAACAYHPFPEDFTKGILAKRKEARGQSVVVNATETQIWNTWDTAFEATATLLEYVEGRNGFVCGYNFMEFNGKRYVIYGKRESAKEGRVYILEGETTDSWVSILNTADVKFRKDFSCTSGNGSTHSGMDVTARIIGDELYIAAVYQNVGLGVWKMYLE